MTTTSSRETPAAAARSPTARSGSTSSSVTASAAAAATAAMDSKPADATEERGFGSRQTETADQIETAAAKKGGFEPAYGWIDRTKKKFPWANASASGKRKLLGVRGAASGSFRAGVEI